MSIDRTARQSVERDIGMEHVGHHGHIGGIQVLVAALSTRRGVGRIDLVARAIHKGIVAGILVAASGVVRPAVVPANTHRIHSSIAFVSTVRLIILPEMYVRGVVMLPSPLGVRNLGRATAATPRIVFFQNSSRLAIGAGERNPQVPDVGMLHLEPHILDVLCALDDTAIRIAAHVNADDSDAAAVAGCAVGNKQNIRVAKVSIVLYELPKLEYQHNRFIFVQDLLYWSAGEKVSEKVTIELKGLY